MKKSKKPINAHTSTSAQALAREGALQLSKLGGTHPEIQTVPRRRSVGALLVSVDASK